MQNRGEQQQLGRIQIKTDINLEIVIVKEEKLTKCEYKGKNIDDCTNIYLITF